jgi:hypothetical protein
MKVEQTGYYRDLQYKNMLKDLSYELRLYHNHISQLKPRKLAIEQEIIVFDKGETTIMA